MVRPPDWTGCGPSNCFSPAPTTGVQRPRAPSVRCCQRTRAAHPPLSYWLPDGQRHLPMRILAPVALIVIAPCIAGMTPALLLPALCSASPANPSPAKRYTGTRHPQHTNEGAPSTVERTGRGGARRVCRSGHEKMHRYTVAPVQAWQIRRRPAALPSAEVSILSGRPESMK